MAVIKEYRCSDCNRIFDSSIPSCIHCGSTTVTRIFTQPFGFKSDKTKYTDGNIQHLTESYGLTDYSNNLSTKHERSTADHWAPATQYLGKEAPLATVPREGSFPIKEIKGRAAGKYIAEYHREDKVV